MKTPFTYGQFVTGDKFIARTDEVAKLQKYLTEGKHVLLYEAPKYGKKSLIWHTLQKSNLIEEEIICNINLFNVRSETQAITKFKGEFAKIFKEHSQGDLFRRAIEEIEEPEGGELNIREADMLSERESLYLKQILDLPQILAEESGKRVIIYVEEFQELLILNSYHHLLRLMEEQMKRHTLVTYIITGSIVNSMKWIFEEYKYFYNFATRIKLKPLDRQSVFHFYRKSFFTTGRVISPELSSRMHKMVAGHPWYLQQLGEIAYVLTRGFLSEEALDVAFTKLLQIHSYRFQIITSRLTRHQINFLKATIDGVTQYSSAAALEKYRFNSSANVKRLKDAVKRKDLLTKEGKKFRFLDPLFKVWLQEVYFQL